MDKQSFSKLGTSWRYGGEAVSNETDEYGAKLRTALLLNFAGADSACEHWCYCSLILGFRTLTWKKGLESQSETISVGCVQAKRWKEVCIRAFSSYFGVLCSFHFHAKRKCSSGWQDTRGLWCLSLTLWCAVSTSGGTSWILEGWKFAAV